MSDKSLEPGCTALNRLPASLVLLLAGASAFSVANVYYAQPLLDAIAEDFNISLAAVGMVIAATQLGCALALLLVVPLGDRVNRHRLLAAQQLLLIAALLAVGWSHGSVLLLAGMLLVGLLGTAMTQGLIAFAATLAAPHERGRVVGAAQGGVVLGLLLARTLSGALADLGGWRTVYFFSAGVTLVLLPILARLLPAPQLAPSTLGYPALLRSMLTLLLRDRTLQIRGMLALLMFGTFSIFWSALVLPLSRPPFNFSHSMVGAFGLVGAVGALAAMRAGQLADRGLGQLASGVCLLLLALAWLPLGMLNHGLAWLVAGIVLLDLAGQAIHVLNQSMIFSAHPQSHSRLVGCYMLFYAVGSGLGAFASTHVYAWAGWSGVCWLGAGVSLSALLFWRLTLRFMPGRA
ncbi:MULTISPECIES: MFS transporter [Serratia]|uniref:Inner membrane transport protein ynfM n=1 Tax=Serratia ficaria TaxID=61651 RepID=A0A240C8W5_SERFI|nr:MULTISPECIES: MFS transporter [Serratia]REF43558.1 putative MFS family arabinose efflux permease [Serratia ficaria]CAI0709567.1 Inner membrane transport protein ynfM [Serratia ficaria]CAI1115602.1 Inner membrane transport protein ynfM [Serratia ficaria]CAI1126721.1 Inner membrane transport protein ynfM [Serratia ficaria]CAI2081452.1 Inner membrane transport protein ynfM [Serratia ficaria]